MISFFEAREAILAKSDVLGVCPVGLLEAQQRVCAEEVASPWDMPSFDSSAMDGYAVRSKDCMGSVTLEVTGYIPAGAVPDVTLVAGCAINVMTGAPIPFGSDAVVPFEQVLQCGNRVEIRERVQAKQHVRFKGQDVCKGEVVLRPGTVLHASEISMLASAGRTSVLVYRRPRVGIVSTGDELVEAGEPVGPGKVINSNTYSLAAAVQEAGGIPILAGIARDDLESLKDKLRAGLEADVLIVSAGVSTGARDLVRNALADLGANVVFYRVGIQPGGPMAFYNYQHTLVFCLPGNPVAAMLTFDEFVRPALLRMMGHQRVFRPFLTVRLGEEARKKPGKIKLLRVRIRQEDGKPFAYGAGNQSTGMLKTSLLADAVVFLPAERTHFAPGDEVVAHFLYDKLEEHAELYGWQEAQVKTWFAK